MSVVPFAQVGLDRQTVLNLTPEFGPAVRWSMHAVEPLDLIDHLCRVAVAPVHPKVTLATGGAVVWATPGKLDDCRPAQTKTPIVIPVLDELPADAKGIEILNRGLRNPWAFCRSAFSFWPSFCASCFLT